MGYVLTKLQSRGKNIIRWVYIAAVYKTSKERTHFCQIKVRKQKTSKERTILLSGGIGFVCCLEVVCFFEEFAIKGFTV